MVVPNNIFADIYLLRKLDFFLYILCTCIKILNNKIDCTIKEFRINLVKKFAKYV